MVMLVGPMAVLIAVVPQVAARTPSWWNTAWPYRVRVECAPGEGDVAWATLMLGGRTTPDGRDIRVMDAGGNLQPFRIAHHDPWHQTVIQFKVSPMQASAVWVYYGNADAEQLYDPDLNAAQVRELLAVWQRTELERIRSAERRQTAMMRLGQMHGALADAKARGTFSQERLDDMQKQIDDYSRQVEATYVPPEARRPQIAEPFDPQRGLLLTIYRKAVPRHPKTLDELQQMIGAATNEGAAYRTAIADGYNPFGASDHYISRYDGYLRIEQPGEYAFCSVSSDGSWIVVNDRTLLSWPGPHGWGGSERGQKHGKIKLDAGVARIAYFHEKGTGRTLAYLAWMPPGAERFEPIPPEQWLSARRAEAAMYEGHRMPVFAAADVKLLSSYWVIDSDNQQTTLLEFSDRSSAGPNEPLVARWSFGDGLEAEGPKVEHLYFRLGRPRVTLTVSNPRGQSDSVTFAPPVFTVDVQAAEFPLGEVNAYNKLAADYDGQKMHVEDLSALAWYWCYQEQWEQMILAAEAMVKRFPGHEHAAPLAGQGAAAMLRPERFNPESARQLLMAAAEAAPSSLWRYRLRVQLAHLLTWHLHDPSQAEALVRPILDNTADRLTRRDAMIALGDIALAHGDLQAAHHHYEKARDLAPRATAQPEELAKAGGYPFTVEDFLARGEYEWALRTIDQWEEQFPTQKIEGYSFFLRGKVVFVQKPSDLALHWLDLAEQVNPKAIHVPEAVWLRANCYLALHRYDEAMREFSRIRHDFTESEFFIQAAEKIKQCQDQISRR